MAGILGEQLGFAPDVDLRSYAATLLFYGGGIAAIGAGRYDTLHDLFERTQVARWADSPVSAALVLYGSARLKTLYESHSLDDFMKSLPGKERLTPTSDRLHNVIREPARDIEPDDNKYDSLFDRFECLLALTNGHIQAGPVKKHRHIVEARPTLPPLSTPMPVGRFGWRRNNHDDIIAVLRQEQSQAGANWPPLEAGMIDGDAPRFVALLRLLDSTVRSLGWQ
jgi:hypothetical protein